MTVEQINNSIKVDEVLLWQYNNATKLQTIIENKQAFLDTNFTQFFDDWYNDVFNLATANDFGLSVWAVILNVNFANAPATPSTWFSFDGVSANFDNGIFYPENTIYISTEDKRTILQFRYKYLISNGNINDVCNAVQALFTGATVTDNLNMTITVNIPFTPTIEQLFILNNYNVIPVPAGVSITYNY